MTGTQFTKSEVEEIIKKNKENDGFVNEQYSVLWIKTYNTALAESGVNAKCIGLVKVDASGKEYYNEVPKNLEGVVCPITGPIKGTNSGHYVEGSLPSGDKTVYNPGNTDITLESKEIVIPMIKIETQPVWNWAGNY